VSVPDPAKRKQRLAVFHNLPVGGGICVAGALLNQLVNSFSIKVHYPEGSHSPDLQESIDTKEWPFREGRNISGLRKVFAPVSLPARLRAFDRLCRAIAEEINSSSDIALVHNSMFIAAPPILKYLTVPSFYFCYEYPRHLYESALVKRTDNRIFRFFLSPLREKEKKMDMESILSADSVITFSKWMKNRIKHLYGLNSLIVRPGIDTDYFRIEDNAVKRNIVLSIGALWPFKGHDLAISTVSQIEAGIRPSLVIAADRVLSGHEDSLMKQAAELGVNLCIRRGISNDELRVLYSTGKAVLCCQNNEPYGLVPLEAMACGMPVVAVNEGGFKDNIMNGENGILVNRDPAEMAEAVKRILTDDSLRSKLITAGRKFVTRERTSADAAESLAEILSRGV